MYEKKQGSERLVSALERATEDENALRRLAAALNYLPDQLKQDVRAARAVLNEASEKPAQEEN